MEIAFLQAPDVKPAFEAPQAVSSEEFSALLASLLEQAGSVGFLKHPVEAPSGTPVVVEGGQVLSGQENEMPEAAEARKGHESYTCEAKDGLKNFPVESRKATTSALDVKEPSALFVHSDDASATVVPSSVEAKEGGPDKDPVVREVDVEAPVNHAYGPAPETTGAQAAFAVVTGPKDVIERANPTGPRGPLEKTGPVTFEAEKTHLVAEVPEGFLREHFEVEVPEEAIMRDARGSETSSAPAAPVAQGKAEALPEALPEGFPLQADTMASVDNVEIEELAEGGQEDANPVPPDFEQGHDTKPGHDGGPEAGLAGPGSQAGVEDLTFSPERGAAPVSFEKLVEGGVKEAPSQPARFSTVTAEVREKVQAGLRVSLDNSGGEVRMKLNPESLGEVRIRLNVDSGVVRAEITVESAEVKRIIESDSTFLRESLGTHGLTLDKCVVEVARAFDARGRDGSAEEMFSGGGQKPSKEREQEKNGAPWQGRYRQENGRHEDGRLDFFI